MDEGLRQFLTRRNSRRRRQTIPARCKPVRQQRSWDRCKGLPAKQYFKAKFIAQNVSNVAENLTIFEKVLSITLLFFKTKSRRKHSCVFIRGLKAVTAPKDLYQYAVYDGRTYLVYQMFNVAAQNGVREEHIAHSSRGSPTFDVSYTCGFSRTPMKCSRA